MGSDAVCDGCYRVCSWSARGNGLGNERLFMMCGRNCLLRRRKREVALVAGVEICDFGTRELVASEMRIAMKCSVRALSARSGLGDRERLAVGGRVRSVAKGDRVIFWPECYHVETRSERFIDGRRLRTRAVCRHEACVEQERAFS